MSYDRSKKKGVAPSAGSTEADAIESIGLRLALNPIRPAYEQVVEQLRNLVINGDLRPGERLPSEADLAALFGVGRSTVREALRLLSSQGLVITRRGATGGTFVVSPDRDTICKYLEASLGLLAGPHRPGTDDLLEARMVLERPASRLAAIRHDDVQLSRIKDTISTGPVANEDMFQSHFHVAVLEASGNAMLEVMTRPVFDVLRTRMIRSAAPVEFWDRVVDDHRRILGAIAARDGDEAELAMQEHLLYLSPVYSSIDSVNHPDVISRRFESMSEIVEEEERS